jgi:hypothetical protein
MVGSSLIELVVLVVTAGLLMVFAGAAKRQLRWKPAEQRCRLCGRREQHDCPRRR